LSADSKMNFFVLLLNGMNSRLALVFLLPLYLLQVLRLVRIPASTHLYSR